MNKVVEMPAPMPQSALLTNLPDELESLARQMRAGDFTESTAAILLLRDAEIGLMTICPFGPKNLCNDLLREAADVRGVLDEESS